MVSVAGRRRHRHRVPSFADPPQRCHRRACLPALLQPPTRSAAHPGHHRRSALAHRGIVPSRQRTGRTGSAPGAALALLAPLDHPGHARPCLPGRSHSDRTRYRTHPRGPDRLDRQRVSTPLRRTAARHPPHPNKPAGLVTMAKTTPIPSPTIPLPTPRTPMISIYGCSTTRGFVGHNGSERPSRPCRPGTERRRRPMWESAFRGPGIASGNSRQYS